MDNNWRARKLALAALALGAGVPSLRFYTRKPEKYHGQRRAYLIGANCPEVERMRAELAAAERNPANA